MIGDVVGRPGRSMIKQHLPRLKKEHGIDFVVANYGNVTGICIDDDYNKEGCVTCRFGRLRL